MGLFKGCLIFKCVCSVFTGEGKANFMDAAGATGSRAQRWTGVWEKAGSLVGLSGAESVERTVRTTGENSMFLGESNDPGLLDGQGPELLCLPGCVKDLWHMATSHGCQVQNDLTLLY